MNCATKKRQCLATVAVGAVILFLRFPDALLHPQLFAEGGLIFFTGAYDSGRFALLIPYAGYLLLFPRIVAWGAMGFDPRWTPAIYNGCAFLAEILVLGFVCSPRVRLPFKPALVLTLALVPHTGEVINSFLNVLWWLALALILILVSDDAGNGRQRLFDWGTVVLCGLTGPFSLFLLPLFLVRAWIRRSRDSAAVAALAALVAAIQLHFVCAASALVIHHGYLGARESVAIASARLFGTYWAGYGLGIVAPSVGWLALGAALAAAGIWLSCRPGPFAGERRMLAGAVGCLVVPVWLKFGGDFTQLAGVGNGDRYFFLPHVLIGWLLVVTFAAQNDWKRWLTAAAAAAALAGNATYLYQPPLPHLAWDPYLQPVREGRAFSIPINPLGWVIESPGKNSKVPR